MGDNNYGDNSSMYDQVIANRDFAKWKEAMQSKTDSMYLNQVWTLVDLSKRIVPIGYR